MSGELSVGKGVAFSDDDTPRGKVIEKIMCSGAVNLDEIAADFSAKDDWYNAHEPELAQLKADGLIKMQKGQMLATSKGQAVVRVVAAVFDTYLVEKTTQHAVAV